MQVGRLTELSMENNTIYDSQNLINEEKINFSESNCSMTNTLKIVGGKWKLLLLNCFQEEGPIRFGKLKSKMQDITQAMLTTQLRELERDGIISRAAYAESPPRVEYSLTAIGKTLLPVLKMFSDWGENYCAVRKTDTF